jgi:hypothetical protein
MHVSKLLMEVLSSILVYNKLITEEKQRRKKKLYSSLDLLPKKYGIGRLL